jgi:outer membrane murein-binding lipoprotein Lpp
MNSVVKSRCATACALLPLLLLAGCTRTYYKAMATLGKEKRDILVSRVKDSKKEQQQAKEQIKTTMESFQALTGFQGGQLEKNYKKLNSEYEKADDTAKKLHDRIDSIDKVSNDLFKEWQKEIDGMDNRKLKQQSANMLRQSRLQEAGYLKSMRLTEARMSPVISAFHDQVIFLKHNLNARAIGSLKGTSAKISTDVDVLLTSLDGSMAQADALIQSLDSADK